MKAPQPTDDVTQWLLAGDPSIRWQALRDIVGATNILVERERANVVRDGWGARLLGLQDAEGTWGHGLYTPKWTSTTYTLLLLRDLGSPATPRTRKACRLLLDNGLQPDGGIGYGWGVSETCVTSMTLAVTSYNGCNDKRLEAIVAHLLEQQMPDGGWNCRRRRGATHSSVHTTISALDGLRDYEELGRPAHRDARAAQRRGQEFLLAHRLFKSHRTGMIIKPDFMRFAFPPRWHYDVLRALEYFRRVDAPRDARLLDAIDLVRSKRREDGTWNLENVYSGKTFFGIEKRGVPSRWITLRALRVLRWWEGGN